MLLKKIEIYGFKSFPQKVEIELSPGITGIIGPNGCGKSNISDAVRWCLGEQSFKTLRGNQMEDMIFNGTDQRKPISFAEVSLLFDNLDPELNVDYTEVNVTRRLFRSGESDYLLNKVPCRLKEITELFHDTGVGKEAYSLIGQGKIDQILSARPEDRRSIFEEAAGVYKYKSRKKETLRRLKETADNLLRVSDLIEELNQQLGPMEEQAAVAREYMACRDRLKHLEIGVLAREFGEINRKKTGMEERLDKISLDIFQKYSLINQLDSVIAEQKLKISTEEEEIEEFREKLYQVEGALKKKKSDTELFQEKLANMQSKVKELEITRGEHQEKLAGIKEKKSGINDVLLELDQTSAELVEELVKNEKQIKEMKETARKTTEKIEEALNEAVQKIEEISLKLKKTQLEREYLEARLEEISKETGIKEAALSELKRKKTHMELVITEKKQEIFAHEKVHQETLQKLRNQESRAASIQGTLRDKSARLEKARAYLEALLGMQQKFEGYNEAVKAVLREKRDNPDAAGGVEGVVADLLTVPEQYERAVEAGLGSAAQHLVTRDENTAKEMIAYLKEIKKGRATFLPLSLITGGQKKSSAPDEKGIIGWAKDLVTFDKEYEKVFDRLLGNLLIAEDLDSALKTARKMKLKYKIVTLEGEIIFPGGAMTGGSYQKTRPGFISRKNTLRKNEQRVKELETEAHRLQEELESAAGEKDTLEEACKEKGEQLNRLTQEMKQQEEEMESVLREIKKTETNLIEIKELEKLEKEKTNQNQDTEKTLLFELKDLREQREGLEKDLGREKTAQMVLNKEMVEKDKEAARLKVEIASKNKEKHLILEKMEDLENERAFLESKVSGIQQKTGELTHTIKEITFSIKRTEKEILQLENSQETISHRFSRLRDQTRDLHASLTENEHQARNHRRALQTREKKKHETELEITRLDTEMKNYSRRLRDEFSLTLKEALDYSIEVGEEKAREEIQELKNKILEFGSVNTGAVQEYDRLLERVEFLKKQRDDLRDAKNNIHKVIQELDSKMKEKFLDSFHQIKTIFSSVFKDFFEGGRAYLKLTDPNDVLESGVEIIAQPPGKKLQNLSLLSGGEKALTAIALLFSVIKVKPAPFCILDEIDVSLDGMNLKRFLNYLKVLSDNTQFILITHRRKTMETAGVLYGVTMEEPGVSKVFSLRLPEEKDKRVS